MSVEPEGRPSPAAEPPPAAAGALTPAAVIAALKPVVDPEIRIGIVDLGLIYGVELQDEGKVVVVRMTLTTPMCPYGPMLVGQVQDIIGCLPGVIEGKVTLVWEPPWDPRTMASDEAKDLLNIW